MGVTASGPPFASLCKCGWMWEHECKKAGECGLNQGMPEYDQEGVIESELIEPIRHEWKHTPYEFLHEMAYKTAACSPPAPQIVDIDKICREVVEDLVKDSKSTHQVGGTHYETMPLQPWEVFRKTNTPEGYCTYHINTVMAYLMRHDKKGGLVDIKKAADHLRELIRYFEEEQEYPF